MEDARLYSKLVSLFRGDPDVTRGKDGHVVHQEIIEIARSLLGAFEVEVSSTRKDSQPFDAVIVFDRWSIGLEVKMGTVTVDDIDGVVAKNRYSENTNAVVLLTGVCKNPELVERVVQSKDVPILVLTYDDFISLHKLAKVQGNFVEMMEDLLTRSSRPEIYHTRQYVEKVFGRDFWNIVKRNDFAMDVFRKNIGIIDEEYSRIAIVGPTNAGKSSLLNVLFGEDVMEIAISIDTTDKVAKIDLPSGLVLYDTPGIGGLSDIHENITRAFLGLPQSKELRKVTKIPVLSCAEDKVHEIPLTKKKKGAKSRRDSNLEIRDIDAVLFVYDISTGMRRQDASVFNQIKRRVKRALLVANKVDLLDETEVQDALEPIRLSVTPDIVTVAVRPKSGEPRDVEALVDSMFHLLSPSASVKFNDAVLRKYQRTRDQLIDDVIKKIAARAAVIKVDAEVVEGVRELETLFLGLLLRIGVDFEVGGPVVRDRIIAHLGDAISSLADGIEEAGTEIKVVWKDERVRRRVPLTGEGALGGGALGALVGAVGGPLGILLGAILGGTLGATVGSSTTKVIVDVITVPIEETRVYAGGYQAVLGCISFGRTLKSVLERMEAEGTRELGQEFLDNVQSEFRENYASLLSRLTEEQKSNLDSAESQEEAYNMISSL